MAAQVGAPPQYQSTEPAGVGRGAEQDGGLAQRVSQDFVVVDQELRAVAQVTAWLTSIVPEDPKLVSAVQQRAQEGRRRLLASKAALENVHAQHLQERAPDVALVQQAMWRHRLQRILHVGQEFQQAVDRVTHAQRAEAKRRKDLFLLDAGASRAQGGNTPERDLELGDVDRRMQQHLMANDNLRHEVDLIEERQEQIAKIERDTLELLDVFQQLQVLVDAQQESLDHISDHVQSAAVHTHGAEGELVQAAVHQNRSRKLTCCLLFVLLIILVIIIAPILATQLKK